MRPIGDAADGASGGSANVIDPNDLRLVLPWFGRNDLGGRSVNSR